MAQFIVLGAGIVGACAALALRNDGHDVTLIDRDEPGNGCSFGNAGFIQSATPHPMATPSILKNCLRYYLIPKVRCQSNGAIFRTSPHGYFNSFALRHRAASRRYRSQ